MCRLIRYTYGNVLQVLPKALSEYSFNKRRLNTTPFFILNTLPKYRFLKYFYTIVSTLSKTEGE